MSEEDFQIVKVKIQKKGLHILDEKYHPESFGSWYFTIDGQPKVRIVWDGKDPAIYLQKEDLGFSNRTNWNQIWFKLKPSIKEVEKAIDILKKEINE